MEIWNLLSDINAEAGGLYCRVKKIITDLYVLYKIIDFIHTRRVRACVCFLCVCVCVTCRLPLQFPWTDLPNIGIHI